MCYVTTSYNDPLQLDRYLTAFYQLCRMIREDIIVFDELRKELRGGDRGID